MPLKPGSSSKTVSSNIKELHTGKTYAKTAAKSGTEKANKQAVAIALSKAGETPKRAMGGPLGGGFDYLSPSLSQGLQGAFPNSPLGVNSSNMNAPMGLGQLGQALPGMMASMSPEQTMIAQVGAKSPQMGAQLASTLAQQNNAERGYAKGGFVPHLPKRTHFELKSLTKGPIVSGVPGRTDAHFTHVPSGSYVIPADIVSGRGQGNTLAGMTNLQKLFKMGPYGTTMPKRARGGMVSSEFAKFIPRSAGGALAADSPSTGKPVRVNLAGGEIVVPPENLKSVVHPHLKTAHEAMDKWVLHERNKLKKTLAKLPGPAKS